MAAPGSQVGRCSRRGDFTVDMPDQFWERIEPLLPKKQHRFRYPGRLPAPTAKSCADPVRTAHRHPVGTSPERARIRLECDLLAPPAGLERAGVWQRLHEVLLAEPNATARLDWSRRVVDSSHVRAGKREIHTGPSPVDRGRAGSKHHLITDGHGTLLAILTGGNRNDVTHLMPLLDAIPPIRGHGGHHGAGPARSSLTAATTTTSTTTRSAPAAPCPPSPAETPAIPTDLASTGGWWSGVSPGCTASADSASDGNGEPTSTKPSSNWPAASSPTGNPVIVLAALTDLECDMSSGSDA